MRPPQTTPEPLLPRFWTAQRGLDLNKNSLQDNALWSARTLPGGKKIIGWTGAKRGMRQTATSRFESCVTN